jgi:hypothetical protein
MDTEYTYHGYMPSSPLEEEEEKEEEKEKEEKEKGEEPGVRYEEEEGEEEGEGEGEEQEQDPSIPKEYVEPGTLLSRPIWHPSESDWRYATQVLESHILFTTSSAGLQPPVLYMKYLVGKVFDPFTGTIIEYMLSYEPHPKNPCHYVWFRHITTYYQASPMPSEKNIFYPYPLPLPMR